MSTEQDKHMLMGGLKGEILVKDYTYQVRSKEALGASFSGVDYVV